MLLNWTVPWREDGGDFSKSSIFQSLKLLEIRFIQKFAFWGILTPLLKSSYSVCRPMSAYVNGKKPVVGTIKVDAEKPLQKAF